MTRVSGTADGLDIIVIEVEAQGCYASTCSFAAVWMTGGPMQGRPGSLASNLYPVGRGDLTFCFKGCLGMKSPAREKY